MSDVLVFLYDDMADFEITFLTHLLGADCGKNIITISYEDKLVKSKCGISYKPDMVVKDALDTKAECLIIPGGWNGEIRSELLDLINKMYVDNACLAAICAGPRFLAKAGILDKVKYTTSVVEWTDDHKIRFKEEDPFNRDNFIDQRVVVDSNVVTATGTAFIDFAIAVLDNLKVFENEKEREELRRAILGN